MLKKKPTDRHKTISEYVDALYSDVSNTEKEAIAKTLFTELSDEAVQTLRQKMEEML